MSPNAVFASTNSSPPVAASTAFSLDGFIAQCREKKTASAPDASQCPTISLDALLAQSCPQKRTASTAAAASDAALASEIDEIIKKLSLLKRAKQRVYLKTTRVPEISGEKYPDLSIALAVQNSNKKRTWEVREMYGWRQYLGVCDMREKADRMIEQERVDRFRLYDDLAVELKTTTKAIDEAKGRLQNLTAKRSSEEEEGKLVQSSPKKRRDE